MKSAIYTILSGALLAAFVGCGDVDRPTLPDAPTVAAFVEEGWAAYSTGDYEGALEGFDRAVERDAAAADAFLGRGYSYSRLGQFDKAMTNFILLLSLPVSDQFKADAYAGMAGAQSANNQDSVAIFYAKKVLEVIPSGYKFSRGDLPNGPSISLLIAQSYFNRSEFFQSQQALAGLASGFPAASELESVADDALQFEVTEVVADADTSWALRLIGPQMGKIVTVSSVADDSGNPYVAERVENSADGIADVIYLGVFAEQPTAGTTFSASYASYKGAYGIYLQKLSAKINELYGGL